MSKKKHKLLFIKEAYGWRKVKTSNYILWIKGTIYNFSDLIILKKLILMSESSLKKFFRHLDGHFALIFEKKNKIICAVDEVSSIPIFYYKDKENFFITPFPNLLKKKINKKKINKQILALSMSSYTVGDQTIYKNFFRLRGGSYFKFNQINGLFNKYNYYIYKNLKFNNNLNYKLLFNKLSNLNLSIINKIYKFSIKNNKNIAIPLSAGYDSRFIVSCLKHLGAKNVLCFSYGQKNNFEAEAAKKISNQLGYPWHFVKLSNSKTYKTFETKKFKKFCKLFDTFCSVSSAADIPEFQAIDELKKKKILNNSIIVNGNSGDFISGNHILDFKSFKDKNKTLNNLIYAHIKKHYRLWNNLGTKENDQIIFNLLKSELQNFDMIKNINKNNMHLINEFLEFYDRQSKHVISKQRVYEYFNLQWSLPLWDKDYIEFWRTIPKQYKNKQVLYEDVLIKKNYGGVWKNKKWKYLKNDMTTRLNFFRFFVRPFFKFIFLFAGKSAWHKFERKYVSFFTDILCNLGISSYKELFLEKRDFRNFLSIHTDKYLKKNVK